MKKFSIIALALAVLVSFGCAKDYLDTYPTSSTSPGSILGTTDAAVVAVNGLGKLMHRQYGAYGQGYNGEGTVRLYFGDYLGNNLMKGNSTSFQNSANGNLYVSNTATLGSYAWYYYYMLIGNANTIIKEIDNAEGTDADKAYIKAQALTYRAYSYFNLAQIYGRRWSDGSDKPSCVLRLTGEEPDNLDRATQGEVYAQVYADLDEAINLFNKSGKANKRSDTHIVDLDVAYGVYARVALTREDWSNALKYAQMLRSKYPLQSVTEELAGFSNPTNEWIWSIYGAEDETLYFYDYFCYAAYNAQTSTTRNYPIMISRHLFDQIPTTDIRRAWWLDPAGYEGQFNTNTMKASSTSNKLTLYGRDYAAKVRGHELLTTHLIFAYMNMKISNNVQPGIGHLCLMRGSEMLLIEAEAQYRLGNESAARDLLVELNATTKRDPAYTCDKSGKALMDEIKLYRGIELWAEGFNWFDLKRWGDSISRKTYANGGNWMSSYAVSFGPNEKNNWTWCIPRNETDYNKGISSTANQ
jgi:hypothetical protein